ncbi:Isopentenyldiphosphate isomerase [Paenibacillus tianmuensis]|uniref:Isopentenyldiphosphate isomerase n=1 Tax=Paenibacillus tianmuensis TaxID=624147 RepID=A0A1G4S6E1_9BACL|nr:NUDIX domain-containing protein [Paenibacillus tianmuensis]SCW64601.1 Isopentenyldiphosphate isomerase [Paenibacillus tianmuensis]
MTPNEEIFDIFDERMNPLGRASRSEVHARGLWHQTFHCWIVDPADGDAVLLFQERHPGKDTFPSLLDTSCAGHLLSGEGVEDGVRELEEELGLSIPFDTLVPCGLFAEEDVISAACIDREFCHVFVHVNRQPLTRYRLHPEEVTGLYRVSLEQVRKLAQGTLSEPIRIEGIAPDENGVPVPVERTVGPADFVPHPRAYYELVLKTIDRIGQSAL